jgi:hypothetical protein
MVKRTSNVERPAIMPAIHAEAATARSPPINRPPRFPSATSRPSTISAFSAAAFDVRRSTPECQRFSVSVFQLFFFVSFSAFQLFPQLLSTFVVRLPNFSVSAFQYFSFFLLSDSEASRLGLHAGRVRSPFDVRRSTFDAVLSFFPSPASAIRLQKNQP